MGDYVVGRGHAGSPGSGGASPYLNRGFRVALACGVTPQMISRSARTRCARPFDLKRQKMRHAFARGGM
jgi:hypothetical protein